MKIDIEKVERILDFLDRNEIDFRLVSNFCCGYIFYFLGGDCYPRRYFDYELEESSFEVIEESTDSILKKIEDRELKKDWYHRIEGENLNDIFGKVEEYLRNNFRYIF